MIINKETRHKLINTLKEAQGTDPSLYLDLIELLDNPPELEPSILEILEGAQAETVQGKFSKTTGWLIGSMVENSNARVQRAISGASEFRKGTVKSVDLSPDAVWEISSADGKELCVGVDNVLDNWDVEDPELLKALQRAKHEGFEFLIVNY